MLTREQAEAAFEQVKEQFAAYLGHEGYRPPELIKSYVYDVWYGSRVISTIEPPYAIVWEEGPDNWALRAKDGGRDYEATLELRSIPGVNKYVTVDTAPAKAWPSEVFGEPVTSYILGLWPVD